MLQNNGIGTMFFHKISGPKLSQVLFPRRCLLCGYGLKGELGDYTNKSQYYIFLPCPGYL